MLPEGAVPPPLAPSDVSETTPPAGARQALIIRQWQGICQRLQAVVGVGGMGALFHRALFLAATNHPILLPALGEPEHAMDLDALATALAGHPDTDVAAAADALMQAFVQVLEGLIGAPLTRQLLHPLPASGRQIPDVSEPMS